MMRPGHTDLNLFNGDGDTAEDAVKTDRVPVLKNIDPLSSAA